jgi:hypothetical protein
MGVNLERTSSTPEHDLGQVVEGTDNSGRFAKYRYVQFLDAVTYVAGHLVTRASATTWAVTNRRVGGSSITGHEPIGVVFQATVPAQNQYGWVLIDGLALVSGTYAAGDYLIPHATNDGEAVVSAYAAAKANFNIFGYALSSSLVRVKCD